MKLTVNSTLLAALTEGRGYEVMWDWAHNSYILGDDGEVLYVDILIHHHTYFTITRN